MTSLAFGLAQFLAGAGLFALYLLASNRARDAGLLAADVAGKIAWMRPFQWRGDGLPAPEAN